MKTVFLTDGQWRKVLAATRSLGKEGFAVWLGEERRLATAFFSRYCKRRIIYPSSTKDPQGFVRFIRRFLAAERPDVTIPCEDATVRIFSENLEEFSEFTRIPIAPPAILKTAADKAETILAAQKIGIPIPKTVIAESQKEITAPAPSPLLVKPAIGYGSRGQRIVASPRELEEAVTGITSRGIRALIQELIPREGAGLGVSALLNYQSQPRAVFVHKRIREYPISGGPSTLRISIKAPQLADLGVQLLQAIGWVGAAMVEFKMDPRDGKPKLMEINPRLWGSLQLAIAAGVDFPSLLARLALEGDVEPVTDYREGILARWLLPGDLLHFMQSHRKFKMEPSFFKFWDKNMVYDIISLDDPLPTFARLLAMFAFLFDAEMRRFVFR
jgi:predicted ATP-grasp superfamily ATP-dependent carboligase